MVSGGEHYRAAEERIEASDWQQQEGSLKTAALEVARAQVHATLALAAASLPACEDCGVPVERTEPQEPCCPDCSMRRQGLADEGSPF
jgi:rubrerythrin